MLNKALQSFPITRMHIRIPIQHFPPQNHALYHIHANAALLCTHFVARHTHQQIVLASETKWHLRIPAGWALRQILGARYQGIPQVGILAKDTKVPCTLFGYGWIIKGLSREVSSVREYKSGLALLIKTNLGCAKVTTPKEYVCICHV